MTNSIGFRVELGMICIRWYWCLSVWHSNVMIKKNGKKKNMSARNDRMTVNDGLSVNSAWLLARHRRWALPKSSRELWGMSKLAGWSWEQEALARWEGILVIHNGNSGWMWLEISPLCYLFFNLISEFRWGVNIESTKRIPRTYCKSLHKALRLLRNENAVIQSQCHRRWLSQTHKRPNT